MTSKDFVVTIVPRWADMDLNQHMRHSAFADWASYARTEWLNANGFTMPKLVELRMTPVMFEDRTRYLKEVLLGERIEIELQLAGSIVTDRSGSYGTSSAEAQPFVQSMKRKARGSVSLHVESSPRRRDCWKPTAI